MWRRSPEVSAGLLRARNIPQRCLDGRKGKWRVEEDREVSSKSSMQHTSARGEVVATVWSPIERSQVWDCDEQKGTGCVIVIG